MPFKVVLINKSDTTGGAAVVSLRLLEALRRNGVDARMLVEEKLSDSPFVEVAASKLAIKRAFLAERLKIFIANGFNKATLFQIDTGKDGLQLWNHPLVKEADIIVLNWVNQGILSLQGVRKMLNLGKAVVWTMHDLWCMTGICHHTGGCNRFMERCGKCHLLGKKASDKDLSRKVWEEKNRLYEQKNGKLAFVAVSSWLAEKANQSSLLKDKYLEIIPNAFDLERKVKIAGEGKERIRILFGAARIDDPVKGLPVLKRMTWIISERYPEIADHLELVTFGGVKNKESLEGFGLPVKHLGRITGKDAVKDEYLKSDIVVSSSSYETLPGTLVEAQAYGCIPVSLDRGGQKDIVTHLSTGYLAAYSDEIEEAASRLAEGVVWASEIVSDPTYLRDIRERMIRNIADKFSYNIIARKYIDLFSRLHNK